MPGYDNFDKNMDNKKSGIGWGGLAFVVLAAGASIAYNLYLESKAEGVAVNKLFVLIKEKIYAFLKNNASVQKLDSKDYLVASDKKSLQILIASSLGSGASQSLGCRLLVVDDITKSWGADISYYDIKYMSNGHPINTDSLNSLRLSKIDLHKHIVSNNIATPVLSLVAKKKVEVLHGLMQYLINDDTYLTRVQDDKLIPALNNLASECAMFVRDSEIQLGDNQQAVSLISNPKQIGCYSNPKKKKSVAKKKATRLTSRKARRNCM